MTEQMTTTEHNYDGEFSAPGNASNPYESWISQDTTTAPMEGCSLPGNCSGEGNTYLDDIKAVEAGDMTMTQLKEKYPGE